MADTIKTTNANTSIRPSAAIMRRHGLWYYRRDSHWYLGGRTISAAIAAISAMALLLVVSCSSPFGSNNLGYTDGDASLDDAWSHTSSFRGIPDGPGGYWKSPAEFVADGGGDCEDFATYMLYLLGPDSGAKIAIIALAGRGLHAIIQLDDGTLIEPQCYHAYWDASPLWTLGYDWVMRYSTNSGRKAIDTASPEDVELMKILAACE